MKQFVLRLSVETEDEEDGQDIAEAFIDYVNDVLRDMYNTPTGGATLSIGFDSKSHPQ